jgi:PAS domain S-box-containing protein
VTTIACHPAGTSPAPDKATDRVRNRFVLALGLLACLTVSTQLLLVRTLRLQTNETEIAEVMTRERLLCQQVTNRALALEAAENSSQPSKLRADLSAVIAQCVAFHPLPLALIRASVPADPPGAGKVAEYQQQFQNLIEQAGAIDARRATPSGPRGGLNDRVAKIMDQEARYQAALEQVAERCAQTSLAQREALRFTGLAIVGVTLALLLTQAALVVRHWIWMLSRQARQELAAINERQRSREVIARISKHNELILNAAGEGIWGVDTAGLTVFANPAAAELTGWRVEELIGRPQHALLRHSRHNGQPYAPEECPICRTFAEGTAHHAIDEVFWHRAGEPIPVEYKSTPIVEDGVLIGAVITFKCIAEQKRLQTQLVHAQKLESIGQLAAGIAHEINTPTQYVGDNTRFLKDAFASINEVVQMCELLIVAASRGELSDELVMQAKDVTAAADLNYLTEEVPKAIDQSLEGIGRVTHIVRAMKEFSHPDRGIKEMTDLNKAISCTITVARNEWKYVAELVEDFDPALPHVMCFANDFNQVILNLIVNAAHAIADRAGAEPGSKGTITVTTRAVGEYVEARIADTGGGIPADIRSKIFDPFFTTKGIGKGTGQGLAIAYAVVVEKHSGTIDFESEVGKGTTFIIRIPIKEVGQPRATNETALVVCG